MTKRDRIMLGVIALVAVVAAAWMLAIKPKREEASELADQAAQAQTRLDAAKTRLATAQTARAAYGDAQVGIARLGKAVPVDEDAATILYQLEQSARKAKIDFRSLTLDGTGANPTPTEGAGTASPSGAADVVKTPIKVKFDGEFFQLRRFIDHVNSLTNMRAGKYVSVKGRLFSIDGVGLDAGNGGFPAISAKLTVVAYSAPAPQSAVADTTGSTAGAGTTTASGTTGSTTDTASANTTTEAAR